MNNIKTAVFGGGCFWCTEAVFKMLKGVNNVVPGYTGGDIANPTYEEVSEGDTGHVESVKIEYDSEIVSYETLLTIFFASHNPTELNRQGNDIGTQYRSVIFYSDEDQEQVAETMIQSINSSSKYGKDIVTTVEPLKVFYVAEDYHHDYYEHHKNAPYCQVVINPKLAKIKESYASLLKTLN